MLSERLFDPTTMCTFTLNACGQDEWAAIDPNAWAYWFIRQRPAEFSDPDHIGKIYDQMVPRKKDELIKIALLSDIHMDYGYTPGTASHCSKVLCCRSDSGPPKNPSDAAG